MFEKEAEEYVLGNFSSDYYGEFEMEEITEYSAFQKGADFGYNKANEWHYAEKLHSVKIFMSVLQKIL